VRISPALNDITHALPWPTQSAGTPQRVNCRNNNRGRWHACIVYNVSHTHLHGRTIYHVNEYVSLTLSARAVLETHDQLAVSPKKLKCRLPSTALAKEHVTLNSISCFSGGSKLGGLLNKSAVRERFYWGPGLCHMRSQLNGTHSVSERRREIVQKSLCVVFPVCRRRQALFVLLPGWTGKKICGAKGRKRSGL
jgi:hypothetical protein